MVTVLSTVTSILVMDWNISPAHAAWLSPAHSIWAGSGPAQNGGPGPAHFFIFFKKRKIQKKIYFLKFYNFPVFFYVILINIKQYFYVAKNIKIRY